MDQTINIADLVKTKFEPGQNVWAVHRNYNNRIEHLQPTRIKGIVFQVVIDEKGNRSQKTEYVCHADRCYVEGDLISSLDDIPADQRAARF